jgi:NADH-quinone oxidoreductase subunit J
MVLFIFVIMLLNLGQGRSDLRGTGMVLLAVLLVGVFASQVVPVGRYSPERMALEYTRSTSLANPAMVFDSTQSAARATVERGIPGDIAKPLFQQYLVPFELTSMLLLAAIVGAVVLAKRRI